MLKKCPQCGEAKLFEEFPRHKNGKHGLATYCKPCHNARNRSSIAKGGGPRHYHLRQRYGVGAAEVQAMIDGQDGLCAICLKQPAIQVDHDHETGIVRGILCDGCNGGLSAFSESPQLILRAKAYLEKWR